MARKLIVLALVFVAIFGLAAATAPAPSTTYLPPAEAPLSHDFIGNNDVNAAGAPSVDGGTVVPGPMDSTTLAGGPASEKDGAATLKFSAIVGAAAVAGYFF
ncbi:PREDICTED: anther-specific protein BCP1-like [Populus euphratica]|uniref:Anther-specific protein BCP1-like n=1 Tax=Populus euphratica TaxID=75702 RepID=A0AAJ6Y6G0_POPEU|nr:PREDICTED: anther-specific protein BCP1-like [Populus euphratica]